MKETDWLPRTLAHSALDWLFVFNCNTYQRRAESYSKGSQPRSREWKNRRGSRVGLLCGRGTSVARAGLVESIFRLANSLGLLAFPASQFQGFSKANAENFIVQYSAPWGLLKTKQWCVVCVCVCVCVV
jgi:hypothetical protein